MNTKKHTDHCSQKKYNWKNITEEFSEAVKDIALDELIHDKVFSLFETMSAIEMMDSKMDAGMACNRENNISMEEAAKAGILKLDNLSTTEIIDIMDTTLALLVSWLEGHSLVQTVFTSLYLHKPYDIENDILKTFCLATYKLIDIITDIIYKAMVFEEEDFQTMTYDYQLNPDITEENMISMLRSVEEDLHAKVQVKKSEKKYFQEMINYRALFSRIKFIRALYQCLYSLSQTSKTEKSTVLLECEQLLNLCKDILLLLHNKPDSDGQDTNEIQMIGIKPMVNQRFLPPTFFQNTKLKSRSEAFDYLIKMIERLQKICKEKHFESFHTIIDFFIEFSRNESCVLTRSVLQLLYVMDADIVFGNIPFIDVLKNAVRAFISPPALNRSYITSNSEVQYYVANFFSLCTQPFVHFIQLCGHNRAKQRNKFIHLLEIFATLQNEAKKTDLHLHNLSVKCKWSKPHLTHFSSWILYHILKIMVMYLLSGFELELYSIHEYYYIFWYLYEYSYGWLVSVLTRADSFLLGEHISSAKRKSTIKSISNNNNTNLYKYHTEIVYNRALQNMCGGYYKALVGFQCDGKIKKPHLQFNSEQTRYEHRFAPFATLVSPPPVSYSKFMEMTSAVQCSQQPVDTGYLYHAGYKLFHQASCLLKTISSKDSDISDLLKVANANFIVLKNLAKNYKKDSTISPDFEFLFHKQLPVININSLS